MHRIWIGFMWVRREEVDLKLHPVHDRETSANRLYCSQETCGHMPRAVGRPARSEEPHIWIHWSLVQSQKTPFNLGLCQSYGVWNKGGSCPLNCSHHRSIS